MYCRRSMPAARDNLIGLRQKGLDSAAMIWGGENPVNNAPADGYKSTWLLLFRDFVWHPLWEGR
jgi:hypothetical protein